MNTSVERLVPFEACFNFRDLGGYATTDGGAIAWGRLYRSDTLHRMTPADVTRLTELGVRTVFDLRARHELDEHGTVAPGVAVTHVHLPVIDQVRRPTAPRDPDAAPEPTAFPGELYVRMLESGQTAVRRVFEGLAVPEALPAVFHCMAGKDRTGIIAALVLLGLGVPEATVVDDYVLTQTTRGRSEAWILANEPATAELFALYPPGAREARAETMVAFLDAVMQRYGSIDGLLSEVGVDQDTVAAVRTNLLE